MFSRKASLLVWVRVIRRFRQLCQKVGSQVCANVIASGFYPTSSRATGVAWALGVGRIGAFAGSFGGALMLSAGGSNAALYLILALPATLSGAGIFFAGARQARIPAASSGADVALDMPGAEMGS
ncbi:major facilitator transporter [Caballeronia pedi]|uniref:Major facilitator transporter n=1 Tax=Caballeronia pedi TaxID=1777141 RepID=A0A157ZP94_9BURK|nr:hypothetical protein [Caballeronia pedi]SAK47338.1 major facilitator transporter [Caballeronia pedi]